MLIFFTITVVSENSDSENIFEDDDDEVSKNADKKDTTTLSYEDLMSLASRYSSQAALAATEAARQASRADQFSTEAALYGKALYLEECFKNVRNGVKLIQYKYTALKYVRKFPELRKFYQEAALETLLSLNKKGMGVSLKIAHEFLEFLVKCIKDIEMGKWICNNFAIQRTKKRELFAALCGEYQQNNLAKIGSILKMTNIPKLSETLDDLRPRTLSTIFRTLTPKVLGKILRSFKADNFQTILENIELSDEEMTDILKKIPTNDLEVIYDQYRTACPSQTNTYKLFFSWLLFSEEYKQITDPDLNGRLPYFVDKLREKFPNIKTTNDMTFFAKNVSLTFGQCSGLGKRNKLIRNNTEQIKNFLQTTDIFFENHIEARDCKALFQEVFSGKFQLTDKEEKIYLWNMAGFLSDHHHRIYVHR